MLKQIFVLFVVISMFLSGADAGNFSKESVRMPEGFEGIYLGMSIKELLEVRPNMRPSNRYSPDQKVDLAKLNQSTDELVKNDPLYGLNMVAMYVFRDGKLKNMLITWVGDITNIRKDRWKFISSCHKRWGPDYQKKILKLQPKRKNEHLAPVLLWQKGNTMIVAVCTFGHHGKKLKEGAFTINLFLKSDKELLKLFAGEKVSKSVRDKLFQEVENITRP